MISSIKAYRELRNLSTKILSDAKSKANTMKKLHYENKVLFGPVQKSQKDMDVPAKDINSPESELSSEIYWLLQHDHTKQVVTKGKRSTSSNNSTVQKKKKSGKKKNDIFHENFIPFTKKSLKSILNFPLIATENTTLLRNDVMHDKNVYLPSVSKILQATMSEASRKALMNWKLTKIAELGEEGFNKLQQDHLQRGKILHETLQAYLTTGIQPEIRPQITELWESVYSALETLKPKVESTEIPVEHPFLKYKGVVDCVSRVGNNLSVIEWKKSDKHKNTIELTYDAPIQLAAYLGALSADPTRNIIAKNGYVVVAYSDRKPAEVHHMDEITLRKYWSIWLKRLQEFWLRTRDGTLPEPL